MLREGYDVLGHVDHDERLLPTITCPSLRLEIPVWRRSRVRDIWGCCRHQI